MIAYSYDLDGELARVSVTEEAADIIRGEVKKYPQTEQVNPSLLAGTAAELFDGRLETTEATTILEYIYRGIQGLPFTDLTENDEWIRTEESDNEHETAYYNRRNVRILKLVHTNGTVRYIDAMAEVHFWPNDFGTGYYHRPVAKEVTMPHRIDIAKIIYYCDSTSRIELPDGCSPEAYLSWQKEYTSRGLIPGTTMLSTWSDMVVGYVDDPDAVGIPIMTNNDDYTCWVDTGRKMALPADIVDNYGGAVYLVRIPVLPYVGADGADELLLSLRDGYIFK